MKSILRFFGIIVFAAVFIFATTGCADHDNSSGLSGLPPELIELPPELPESPPPPGYTGTLGLVFELINNGIAYRVYRGSVTSGDVIIPATYKGLPVTEIGSNAFYNTSIISVTIPSSVTYIGYYAFRYCTNLRSITVDADNPNYVSEDGILYNRAKTILIQAPGEIYGDITIPSSVTSIGGGAFDGCASLTSVAFAAGSLLESIGFYAFSSCTNLISITIPSSVTSIGYQAFMYCSSLTSVTIPASVTYIGDMAFFNCNNLTSVTIQAGVTYISSDMFSFCSSLTSITIPNSVTSIGNGAFLGCTSLASVTIPDSVTSIGDGSFSLCKSLTSIAIPSSVTSIGFDLFGGGNLTSITVDAGNPNYSSRDGILYNKAGTVLIEAPEGISGNVIIPVGVTSIGDGAFGGCGRLTSVTIPSSVTSIGGGAFGGCASLTSVTIPSSVTSIGDAAFYNCNNLTSITIPSSITSIGNGVFGECWMLTSIEIPEGVTSIGDGAFSNSRLTSITIPAGVTSIGEKAFATHYQVTRTIYVKGKANQTAADNAWGAGWRTDCRAVIKYWNGSEFV